MGRLQSLRHKQTSNVGNVADLLPAVICSLTAFGTSSSCPFPLVSASRYMHAQPAISLHDPEKGMSSWPCVVCWIPH